MNQGWGHPIQAKPTGDLVSGDQDLWAGHRVRGGALTVQGDALSSPSMGFACKDGGTGGCRLQDECPKGQVGTRARSQVEGSRLFLLRFFHGVKVATCGVWCLLAPCLWVPQPARGPLLQGWGGSSAPHCPFSCSHPVPPDLTGLSLEGFSIGNGTFIRETTRLT